jgi:excinuclease UvrABC ATPase subunit
MLVTMMVVGVSFSGESSVVDLLLAAVKTAFNQLSSFQSLPL